MFSFKKGEQSCTLEVSLKVELKMPSNTTSPPPDKPKVSQPEVQKAELLRLPVEYKVVSKDTMSDAEEIFLMNVTHYQIGRIAHGGSTQYAENLVLFIPEKQIAITYRNDTQKWEVFFNNHLWDHLAVLTSYALERDKYKYLVRNIDIRRTTYMGIKNIEHLLNLVDTDFFLISGEKKSIENKKHEWTMWKELIPA